MTEFNWTQLMAEADVGIVPVPAGEYELQVATAKVGSSNGGKTTIVCRVNVISGPHIGRTAFKVWTLSPESPQAMGFFFRNMKALGLDAPFFAQNPSAEQVAENLVGKLFHAKINIEPYGGEDRNVLDTISPSQMPGGTATVPAPAPLAAPPVAAPAFPAAPPVAAPPMAPPVAPAPVAAVPMAPPPLPVAPAPAPVAPPAPPAAQRQFDASSGMEAVNGAWTWPAEQQAGYVWTPAANAWLPPAAPAAPMAPPAPPMPPAPPAPSF